MGDMERISSFVNSYIKDDEYPLSGIYNKALNDGVPVIRRAAKELLKTQLIIKKPKKILEIGTAVGYSSLFMCQYISKESHITTIELDEQRVVEAEKNIKMLGKEEVIKVIKGDALEVIGMLPDASYDFLFVDAAKGQYINYYEDIIRIAEHDAVIVSDNILQDGEILESHYTVEKRNRTIHDRMREYLYKITHDDRVESAILSVADGMAITIKK
ncbi:MAG: O-methyltransferase [Lachnospiraceae bacterium]|nr:O-methyltransferase [Lachnospiraceae bacterium]